MNLKITERVEDTVARLYGENETAKKFFDWFSTRRKDARETNAEKASEMASVSNADVIKLFKLFEEQGFGRYIVGRKGNQTRISWSYSPIALAAAARGEAQEVSEVGAHVEVEDDENPNLDTTKTKDGTRKSGMKHRALVVFDYEFESFSQAAAEEEALKEAVKIFVKERKAVLFHDFDFKERRGDRHIALNKMKLVNK